MHTHPVRPSQLFPYPFPPQPVLKIQFTTNRIKLAIVFLQWLCILITCKRSCDGVFLLARSQARDHEDYIEDKYCSMYRLVVHDLPEKKSNKLWYGMV
jgi:hypothetical protein